MAGLANAGGQGHRACILWLELRIWTMCSGQEVHTIPYLYFFYHRPHPQHDLWYLSYVQLWLVTPSTCSQAAL